MRREATVGDEPETRVESTDAFVEPERINVRSNGEFVTGWIRLPEGADEYVMVKFDHEAIVDAFDVGDHEASLSATCGDRWAYATVTFELLEPGHGRGNN